MSQSLAGTLGCVSALVVLWSMTSLSLAAGDTWTKKADMPVARAFHSASVVDGKIYLIGGSPGFHLVTVYDPATETWTDKTSMPTPRSWHSASIVNGKIYAIGGWSGGKAVSTVEEYDPATDTWTEKAEMPTRRGSAVTIAVNGKIYAIGGCDDKWYIPTVEEYDPATDTWRKRANMPTKRGCPACAVNGRVYAIGGYGGDFLRVVEEYNPATDTWARKGNLPTARGSFATAVVNGKIYAIGGLSWVGGSVILSTVEEYDPATGIWTKKKSLPTKRAYVAGGAVNGRIYAIGGWIPPNEILATVEEYDTGFRTTIPETWDPENVGDAEGSDLDSDGQSRLAEYIAGTNPNDLTSAFKVPVEIVRTGMQVSFAGRRAEGPGYEGQSRFYVLESTSSLAPAEWKAVPNYERIPANNQTVVFCPPFSAGPSVFYRAQVWLEGP